MKKLIFIFIASICLIENSNALITDDIIGSACFYVAKKDCPNDIFGQSSSRCQNNCSTCTPSSATDTIANNTVTKTTKKTWTQTTCPDYENDVFECDCITTTEYKCASGYYGTIKQPTNYWDELSTSDINCKPCPANATCPGGESFNCNTDNGYKKNTSNDGCIKDGCDTNQYIFGTTCMDCPEYATCDGENFICNKSFYKTNNTCKPCPHGGTTNEKGATNRSACYLPTAKTYSNNAGTFVVTENTCNAKATD